MIFKPLDPIIHSPLRLAVMSLLTEMREADFNFIREKTTASAGNVSAQINKLKDAGYVQIVKSFRENYPRTICKVTAKGVNAFENYRDALRPYLKL